MAYHESFGIKAKKLLRNPKENIGKVLPFLGSKVQGPMRRMREKFGDYRSSKPYPGHDALLKVLGGMKGGFFVEVGGNDGCFDDPTYYLEKALGWKGIIIEPLPIFTLCKRNRRASYVDNSASISFDTYNSGVRSIELVDVNAMSVVKGAVDNEKEWVAAGSSIIKTPPRTITVNAKPVQEVIDHHNLTKRNIDLFVVDVEGYEIEVIKGIDFSRNYPTFIMLEIHTDVRKHEIDAFLKKHGYMEIAEVGNRDFIYKKTPSH